MCSNLVALNQVLFLKIPAVRTYFKIPAKIKHDQDKLPVKKKPFVAGMRESESWGHTVHGLHSSCVYSSGFVFCY